MDLVPSSGYGLGDDLNACLQVSELMPGALAVQSWASGCDLMNEWQRLMRDAGVGVQKQIACSGKLRSEALGDVAAKSSVDPVTGVRLNLSSRRSRKKIVLIQDVPSVVHDEAESPESTQRDFTFYNASLSRQGKSFGSLRGTIETFDFSVEEDDSLEVRFRTLIFDLPKGQILAEGASSYATGPGFVPLEADQPVVIAVTGGTGRYFGVTGEVRTTRRSDDTYRQVITLFRSGKSGKLN
jgi:hypothetical protein